MRIQREIMDRKLLQLDQKVYNGIKIQVEKFTETLRGPIRK